jgi:hypothetical protein
MSADVSWCQLMSADVSWCQLMSADVNWWPDAVEFLPIVTTEYNFMLWAVSWCTCAGSWGWLGRYINGTQWANYRRHADIGFFKNFDFMIDMTSFNVQTNKKERIFQFSKRNVQKFWFLKSEFEKNNSNFATLVFFFNFVKLWRTITQSFLKLPKRAYMLWNPWNARIL